MNDNDWAAIEMALKACWPDTDRLPRPVAAAWRAMLEPLETTLALRAINSLALDGERFRPVIGQILRRATDLELGHLPDFAEAWEEIRRMASGADWSSSTKDQPWSHPLIGETARLVGWRTIMEASPGDPALRAHGRQVFETLLRRASDEHRAEVLGLPGTQTPRLES